MSNKKTIARITIAAWSTFLTSSLILYFAPLPIPLYITENLWVLAVILIPFIIVVAQSAFPKESKEAVTAINLFDDSDTDLSKSMILELPVGKERTDGTPTTSFVVQKSSQTANSEGIPPREGGTSGKTKTTSEAETEKDAVLSLLEGLERQSADGKISSRTYQLLRQKYLSRLEDLGN